MSAILFLSGRLFYLQILSYDEYQKKAAENITRETSVSASRGKIYDRNGNKIIDLDEKYLFRRFYQPGGRKEGSTGLGLALAYSVCARNGFGLSYAFEGGSHIFTVRNAL